MNYSVQGGRSARRIVSRKQGECSGLAWPDAMALAHARLQSIECARAAAHLVHEDQDFVASRCGEILAVSLISTIKVERPRGQIIGGANTREYPVERATAAPDLQGRNCRHEPSRAMSAFWRI